MTSQPPLELPKYHGFPPMYTLQPNVNTRQAQMDKWSTMVQSYCAHARIFKLALFAPPASDVLFRNAKINKKLSDEAVREVLAFMIKDGRAEYVSKERADVAWIYWRTPDEWAALIEAWVEETAQKGSVVTLYEIVEGEGTRGTELHGLDTEVLQKALAVLVKRGKAQIFGAEESQGVKFF